MLSSVHILVTNSAWAGFEKASEHFRRFQMTGQVAQGRQVGWSLSTGFYYIIIKNAGSLKSLEPIRMAPSEDMADLAS